MKIDAESFKEIAMSVYDLISIDLKQDMAGIRICNFKCCEGKHYEISMTIKESFEPKESHLDKRYEH